MFLIFSNIKNKMPKYKSIKYGGKSGIESVKNPVFEESSVVRIIISISVAKGYKIREYIIFGKNTDIKQSRYPKTKTGVQRATIQRLAIIENKEILPK